MRSHRGGSLRPPPPPLMMMLTMVMLMAAAVQPAASLKCIQDGDMGTTYPRHEMNVPPGTMVNVTCLIDLNHERIVGYDSDDLYFTRTEFRAGGNQKTEVPAQHVTVLNSSAIVVSERLERAVKYIYACRLRRRDVPTTGVCQTYVYVGHPPLEVNNFRCILHNWINGLNCSWEAPFNAVNTHYQWEYRLSYHHYSRPCTADGPELWPQPGQPTRHQCSVKKGDFRDTHERFQMVLSAENALGRRVFPAVERDTYAIVLPAAPHNVSASEITSNSLRLDVAVAFPMFAFPKAIWFAVNYTSRWDLDPVTTNATALDGVWNDTFRVRSVLVTGLLPHTDYWLTVRMRSSLAFGEDMWSPPAVVTVRTLSTVPAAAPTATAGSFQLVGDAGDGGDSSASGTTVGRTIYVYWHQIEPNEQNGANFTYCAAAATGDGADGTMTPEEVTPAYARFSRLPLSAVTVRVAACNAEGESRQAVKITVPDSGHVMPRPRGVTLSVSSDSRYRLSWGRTDDPRPHNFTVFWCQHMRDRPFQCQGQLEWSTVSGDTLSHTLQLPAESEYQFAVAANGVQSSSGMVWSRCTVLANGAGIWLGEVYAWERGADYLTVAWNGECTDREQHDYLVYYCLTDEPHCPGNETKLLVSGRGVTSVNVTGLQPYSQYRLSVTVMSRGMAGQRSAPLVTRTRQARPTPPRVTQMTATSNTSVTVRWAAPEPTDGPLHHYRVWLVAADTSGAAGAGPLKVAAGRRHVTVTHLWPYTRYTATVEACSQEWQAVRCSRPSEARSNYTLPGVPGLMEPPRSRLLNVSAALVKWTPPRRPGGPRPRYTLRIVSERDGRNVTANVTLPSDRNGVELRVPDCEPGSPSQRHFFVVRASVRLPDGGRWLHGPWSEPGQQDCVLASDWPTATIVGVVVGGALLMMLVVFVFFLVCSRTKRKLTEMRNLRVNLPPGLERLEKPPAALGAAVVERRPTAAGLGSYGRLVSQNSASTERTATSSVSGQPLLQEDACRDECDGEGYALTAPTNGDSNSCSSGATNFTDSGAECEKGASSPTFNKFQWPPVDAAKMSPYVQVGGPESAAGAAAAPPYSKFSPYVDAKAIQALMARSLEALPADGGSSELHRSVPELAAAAADDESPLPSALAYSQLGGRSSAGYVSMASDDALPPTGRAPSAQHAASPAKHRPPPLAPPELAPYVTLGPPAPPPSAAGFPPYVLAGPPVPGGGDGPPPVGACSPAHDGATLPTAAGPAPSAAANAASLLPSRWAGPRPQELSPPHAVSEPAVAGGGGRPMASNGYILHDKVLPGGGMELRPLPAAAAGPPADGYVSQEALAAAGGGGEPLLSPKKLPTVASSRDPYCRVVTTHQRPPDLGPNVSMV